jgi:hypothetical protein
MLAPLQKKRNEHVCGGYILYPYVKNRRMKLIEIVLGKAEEERERIIEGVNLRHNISTYVNIIMYPLYNC